MRRAEGQVQGGGLPSLMLRNDTSSPTSFPFSCGGTWDEREERSGPKRKHDDTLSEEFLAMLKDAGLESMALEVGTVQGGQIAALGSNKEGGADPEGKVSRPFSSGEASSPGAMTSSSIFSPNPRVTGPPRESPLLLRRSLGSPVPPESMTASAIFSPSPSTDSGVLSYFTESPTAIKGTDMRIVASASESDTPHKSNPKAKRPRRTFDSPAPPQDFSLPEPLPPPLPPPSTRRKRRANRKLCEETSTDTEVSTRRTKKQDAKVGKSLPNKGLRHFSVKVCRKVEEKGTTSYNEVADELVREMASEGDHGNKKDAQYDDKNIRRRVYDALNVLMAIDIISKDRKEITWKGLPECARSGLGALQRAKDERERSLEKKKDQLSELLVQHIACRNLMRKNRALTAARAAALEAAGDTAAMEDAEDVAASKIHLPFIVVSSSDDTVIQCEMAENREDVFFNFSDEFQIADDGEILKRLGMHKCRKQDLPLLIADELIPQVPEDVLIRDHGDRDASSSPPSSPSSSSSNRAPP